MAMGIMLNAQVTPKVNWQINRLPIVIPMRTQYWSLYSELRMSGFLLGNSFRSSPAQHHVQKSLLCQTNFSEPKSIAENPWASDQDFTFERVEFFVRALFPKIYPSFDARQIVSSNR